MKVTIGGKDFALTKGKGMPKRSAYSLECTVSGSPAKLPVTDNIGYAGARDVALQYAWIEVGGKAYYVTFAPGELASEYAAEDFVVSDGTGPKVPERGITRVDDVRARKEFDRIVAFKKTWAKRA
jgi:hypothetical protein